MQGGGEDRGKEFWGSRNDYKNTRGKQGIPEYREDTGTTRIPGDTGTTRIQG